MANIKSAKKRILVIETKTLRNKMIKSKIKTLIKKVDAAVAAGDKALAAEALKNAVIALDKAGEHKEKNMNKQRKPYVVFFFGIRELLNPKPL